MVSPHIMLDRALESLTHPASKQREEAVVVQKMIADFLVDRSLTLAEFDHYCGRLNKIMEKGK